MHRMAADAARIRSGGRTVSGRGDKAGARLQAIRAQHQRRRRRAADVQPAGVVDARPAGTRDVRQFERHRRGGVRCATNAV